MRRSPYSSAYVFDKMFWRFFHLWLAAIDVCLSHSLPPLCFSFFFHGVCWNEAETVKKKKKSLWFLRHTLRGPPETKKPYYKTIRHSSGRCQQTATHIKVCLLLRNVKLSQGSEGTLIYRERINVKARSSRWKQIVWTKSLWVFDWNWGWQWTSLQVFSHRQWLKECVCLCVCSYL